jgi:hypothetical protein
MNQVIYMFENPVLTLVNVVMLLGILLAVASMPWLNKITREQRKRNDAMQKENMRLQSHLQQ